MKSIRGPRVDHAGMARRDGMGECRTANHIIGYLTGGLSLGTDGTDGIDPVSAQSSSSPSLPITSNSKQL